MIGSLSGGRSVTTAFDCVVIQVMEVELLGFLLDRVMTGMTGDDQIRDGMQSKSSLDTSASDRRTTGVVSKEIQQKTSSTGGFLLLSRLPVRETVLSCFRSVPSQRMCMTLDSSGHEK